MKKFAVAAVAAFAVSAAPASAADLVTKAKPMAAPPPPPAWDIAFGGAIASDYVWRGITQSNHEPSVASYFEPRYNVNQDLQLYAGIGGASIAFPNRAAAEIDFYGGVRPTFGKLALDFGVWYYWYPGGQCFNRDVPAATARPNWRPAGQRQRRQGRRELLGVLRQGDLYRHRPVRARLRPSTTRRTS